MPSNPAPTPPAYQPPPSNGLGVAGFVCSILGVLSCGVLAIIGLPLSFFALFKKPRGLAIAGFIISLFAFIPPALLVLAIGGGAVLAMVGLAGFANAMQTEFAAQDIHDHYQQHGQLPAPPEADAILVKHDQLTGHAPRYAATGPTTFELQLPGQDGQWDTADDYSQAFDVTQMQSTTSP
ncbi:MAG: hypothetical protein GVY24_02220 [Planctomycetes bacterium]|jgi:hypothetical protein|nr:hypothetical protein [Planctomycetota bacterium]